MTQQWISVKEKLPSITIDESKDLNESEKVIGLVKGGQVYKMVLTHWFEDEPNEFTWVFDDSGDLCDSVTHWMPFIPPTN